MQTHAKTRASLAATDAELKSRFLAGESVVELVHERSAATDELLRELWHTHMGQLCGDVALVAVGGYGRGELHPSSDVDIMMLLPEAIDADAEQALSAFITSLWDVGFEIGHSVRTVQQCVEQAAADLTVATCACWPTTGPWSPRTIPCRRSGSTPCSLPKQASRF